MFKSEIRDISASGGSHQKEYRKPNWRMRGSPAPVMRPNRPELKFVVGLERFTR